ncbi:MAG TPA: ester cyclase [Planctomycetota bacterium]|nr:ester cyclase [Planctomycetota bacterium]
MSGNNTIIHTWFEEVWNQGKEATIDRLMAPTAVYHGMPDGKDIRGPAEFKPFWRKFRGAFPNMKFTVVECVVQGDRLAARCQVSGTHSGDHLGVPATNRPVSFEGMVLAHLKNGQIAEGWNFFDLLSMNKQLGLM